MIRNTAAASRGVSSVRLSTSAASNVNASRRSSLVTAGRPLQITPPSKLARVPRWRQTRLSVHSFASLPSSSSSSCRGFSTSARRMRDQGPPGASQSRTSSSSQSDKSQGGKSTIPQWFLWPVVLSLALIGYSEYAHIGGAQRTRSHLIPPLEASSEEREKRFAKAHQQLQEFFATQPDGKGALSTDEVDLEMHGFSSWCQHDASPPSVVVFPSNTDDVVAIVNIARKNGVPLIPFAGGTSLEAHWYAARDPKSGDTIPSICIAFDRMADLLELDEDAGQCRVQPGLSYQVLNEDLKSRDCKLYWPVDPGPGAAFGGMLATGGSGTGAVRYGTMKGDLVLNVTVVLPSGEVIKTRSDARKSAAGPDLTKLFLGSEGTLGIITEATLRLVPRLPESVVTVSFPSVESACTAVQEILNSGVGVSAIELLDDVMIKAINFASKPKPALLDSPASLFIKFAGSKVHTAEDQRLTRLIVAKHGAATKSIRLSSTPEEVEELWESRKVALWSAIEYRQNQPDLLLAKSSSEDSESSASSSPAAVVKCWTTDVCVPINRLPELVKGVKADVVSNDLIAPIIGHVGDGNFHCLIVYPSSSSSSSSDDDFHRAQGVVHRMVHLAQDLGGTCTGEHAVGKGKRHYLERELGRGTVSLLKSIKTLLDPAGVMNPGSLVPDD